MIKRTIALLIFACLVIASLAACGNKKTNGTENISTENQESNITNDDGWNIGSVEIEEYIESVYVDWSSGTVTVSTATDSETISIKENDENLPDEKKLQWRIVGTSLYIRNFSTKLINLGKDKNLVLTIPYDKAFKEFKIETASGAVDASSIIADEFSLESASGAMSVANIISKEFEMESSSGKLSANNIVTDECQFTSTSGEVEAENIVSDELEIFTTSGKIKTENLVADEFDLKCTSGGVAVSFTEMPKKLDAESSSGSIALTLPKDAGFTACISTASGEFTSEIPLKQTGETYIAGDGSAEVDISTSSGDITLKAGK